jgi:hypothetical protein
VIHALPCPRRSASGRDRAVPPVPKTVIGGDCSTCCSAWAGTLGIRPSVASFLADAALGNVVFPRLRPFEDDAARAVRGRLPLRNDCRGITGRERRRPRSTVSRVESRPSKSGRQDLNLRPLGPEPAAQSVPSVAGLATSSQVLDSPGVVESDAMEDLPRDAPDGAGGEPFQRRVAADLRRTDREFLRPEDLMPVTAAPSSSASVQPRSTTRSTRASCDATSLARPAECGRRTSRPTPWRVHPNVRPVRTGAPSGS